MRFAATKEALRREMRERLASLSSSQVRVRSAAVRERLSVLPEFVSANWLLVYVSKGHEIDTHGLIQQLLAIGKHACVPKFDEATQCYVASELRDFAAELEQGRFGILEPRQGAVRLVSADKLDAMLVPGLAFDGKGNRIGRGMGFFDRLLREAPGIKIALAYDFQVLNKVPADAHDVCVDFIVTEKQVVPCKRTNQ
ncbi:MAG: 5-formyltetrahydrofolate cyclo-ligase [Verrucomicrobiia bacterium]|jgi:5-formyltetrahydrofolate cyclo-ligase